MTDPDLDRSRSSDTRETDGWAARGGRLYRFNNEGVLVLALWPRPRAWEFGRDRMGWRRVHPELNLNRVRRRIRSLVRELAMVSDSNRDSDRHILETRLEALREALSVVPDWVLGGLHHFGDGHWHLLNTLARCDGAEDLLYSSPALLYAIAHHDRLAETSGNERLRVARRLIRVRQRDAAAILGFPGSEATAKVLRKVPASAVGLDTLGRLREILVAGEHAKELAHAPRINRGVLALLADPDAAEMCTPNLLESVGKDWREDRETSSAALMSDVARMLELLEPEGTRPRFSSVGELREHHDELTSLIHRIPPELSRRPFPKPPVPGIGSIRPIRSPLELLREGRDQRHCVFARVRAIQAGHSFVYRVLDPERATVALDRGSGVWHIGELKAKANQAVSAETREHVEDWFRRGEPKSDSVIARWVRSSQARAPVRPRDAPACDLAASSSAEQTRDDTPGERRPGIDFPAPAPGCEIDPVIDFDRQPWELPEEYREYWLL